MRKLFVVLLLLVSSIAFAGGGGGAFWGYQVTSYPFLENYPVRNSGLGLVTQGGMGLGINQDGRIFGGFGLGINDPADEDSGINGGFGGVITGWRFFERPFTLMFTNYIGVGGINTGTYSPSGNDNFFALFYEGNIEVLFPVLFFNPTLFAGYQVIANITPGQTFEDVTSYSPVVGVRFLWGGF